jgi:hypothetical protein
VGRLRVRDNLEDLGVDKGLILKCILMKYAGGLDRINRAQDRGQVASCYECGNESSDSVKCGEFLDWLRNC